MTKSADGLQGGHTRYDLGGCCSMTMQRKTVIYVAIKALETIALNVFRNNEWRSNNRLCL